MTCHSLSHTNPDATDRHTKCPGGSLCFCLGGAGRRIECAECGEAIPYPTATAITTHWTYRQEARDG